MGDGPVDDLVQGQQEEQGQEGPQAPAHGVDALLLIELCQLLLVFLLIFGILLLQLRLLAGQASHTDHATLGLHLEGKEYQLQD